MKHIPFLLHPVGKDYLWGGERLKTEYHKQIDLTPLAETWECSTHPDGCSVVDSGAAAAVHIVPASYSIPPNQF